MRIKWNVIKEDILNALWISKLSAPKWRIFLMRIGNVIVTEIILAIIFLLCIALMNWTLSPEDKIIEVCEIMFSDDKSDPSFITSINGALFLIYCICAIVFFIVPFVLDEDDLPIDFERYIEF